MIVAVKFQSPMRPEVQSPDVLMHRPTVAPLALVMSTQRMYFDEGQDGVPRSAPGLLAIRCGTWCAIGDEIDEELGIDEEPPEHAESSMLAASAVLAQRRLKRTCELLHSGC